MMTRREANAAVAASTSALAAATLRSCASSHRLSCASSELAWGVSAVVSSSFDGSGSSSSIGFGSGSVERTFSSSLDTDPAFSSAPAFSSLMSRRKYAIRRRLSSSSLSSSSCLASMRANVRSSREYPDSLTSGSTRAASSASARASSSAAAAAALSAASASIVPCSSRTAGMCSCTHATRVYTTASPVMDAACAASCAATTRRIGGGKLGCLMDSSGGSNGYTDPGGKCTSSTHGFHRSSGGDTSAVHMRRCSRSSAILPSASGKSPVRSRKLSSRIAVSAIASSPLSPIASSASIDPRSRSPTLGGCRLRSNAYVASSSIHPHVSSDSRASARLNPIAASRPSIARCSSATYGSSARTRPTPSSSSPARAASAAASARARSASSRGSGARSPPCSFRNDSGISSRGTRRQSQSIALPSLASIALFRCACVFSPLSTKSNSSSGQ